MPLRYPFREFVEWDPPKDVIDQTNRLAFEVECLFEGVSIVRATEHERIVDSFGAMARVMGLSGIFDFEFMNMTVQEINRLRALELKRKS